jgi:hypothetical protein
VTSRADSVTPHIIPASAATRKRRTNITIHAVPPQCRLATYIFHTMAAGSNNAG